MARALWRYPRGANVACAPSPAAAGEAGTQLGRHPQAAATARGPGRCDVHCQLTAPPAMQRECHCPCERCCAGGWVRRRRGTRGRGRGRCWCQRAACDVSSRRTWPHFVGAQPCVPHQLGRAQARAGAHDHFRGLHADQDGQPSGGEGQPACLQVAPGEAGGGEGSTRLAATRLLDAAAAPMPGFTAPGVAGLSCSWPHASAGRA
jgi:hypothetical protein